MAEREAEAFIEILENKAETKLNEKTKGFATKEDIAKLNTKISESKVDIIKWDSCYSYCNSRLDCGFSKLVLIIKI